MKKAIASLFVSAVLILPNFIGVGNWLQSNTAIAAHPNYTPSDDWLESLNWLKENSPQNAVIASWWDYGYYIERIGQRKTIGNPSQNSVRLKALGELFTGQSTDILKDYHSEYVILDQDTVLGKFWAVATWAGENPDDFTRVYYLPQKDNTLRPVQVFLKPYYQNLATRLYWFSGKEVTPETAIGILVKQTPVDGKQYSVITDISKFPFQQTEYYEKRGYLIVGFQPNQSSIHLDSLPFQLIYSTATVKIFALNN